MFNQAKEWGKRPSEILELDSDDPLTAYCLDEAVWYFGNEVENRVRSASKSKGKSDTEKKQQARANNELRKCLGLGMKFRAPPEKGR